MYTIRPYCDPRFLIIFFSTQYYRRNRDHAEKNQQKKGAESFMNYLQFNGPRSLCRLFISVLLVSQFCADEQTASREFFFSNFATIYRIRRGISPALCFSALCIYTYLLDREAIVGYIWAKLRAKLDQLSLNTRREYSKKNKHLNILTFHKSQIEHQRKKQKSIMENSTVPE